MCVCVCVRAYKRSHLQSITSINVHKTFYVHLVREGKEEGVYMASEKPSGFIGLIYAIIKFNLAP